MAADWKSTFPVLVTDLQLFQENLFLDCGCEFSFRISNILGIVSYSDAINSLHIKLFAYFFY